MSRRDTIIVAVLVNAGLLAVLFMMAINSDDDKSSVPMDATPSTVAMQVPERAQVNASQIFIGGHSSSEDEVDNALKDFSSAPTPQLVSLDDDDLDDEKEEMSVDTVPVKIPLEEVGGSYIEITVKSGDSLDKIARANKTTVQIIKQANKLTSEKLKIGQLLRIPLKREVPVAPAVVAVSKVIEVNPSSQSEAQYYTIKKGDNPWKIAKQFNMKVDELLKLNALNEEKARNLKVGDKVRVK